MFTGVLLPFRATLLIRIVFSCDIFHAANTHLVKTRAGVLGNSANACLQFSFRGYEKVHFVLAWYEHEARAQGLSQSKNQ